MGQLHYDELDYIYNYFKMLYYNYNYNYTHFEM